MRRAQALIGLGVVDAGHSRSEVQPAARHVQRLRQASMLSDRLRRLRPPPLLSREYWIGQDLRLTIESAATGERPPRSAEHRCGRDATDRKLDTLHAMFDALRACWIPPGEGRSPSRHANVGAVCLQAQRRDHRHAARDLCQPRRTAGDAGNLPPCHHRRARTLHPAAASAEGLGGAVAGRPIAIRFRRQSGPAVIDTRSSSRRRRWPSPRRRPARLRRRQQRQINTLNERHRRAAGLLGFRRPSIRRGPACRSRCR